MFGCSIRKTLLAPAIAAALLGTAVVASTPAVAQSTSKAPTQEHPGQKLVSVDFAGGTTQQYYDALQKALGQNVVVIMPGAEAVQMPPVKLTNVPFGEAVRVAKYSRESQRIDVESEGHTWIIVPTQSVGGVDQSRRTRTWSLSETIASGATADELLAAVQAGLDLRSTNVSLKYHDATQVLMANGTIDELTLITETLNSAKESAWVKGRSGKADRLEERLALLESDVRGLQNVVEGLAR